MIELMVVFLTYFLRMVRFYFFGEVCVILRNGYAS